MAEKNITCIVASGNRVVFMKINTSTTILDLKFDVSDRLDLSYESLSLSFKDETNESFKFPIENEGDLSSMVEHCHNRGLKEVHMQAFKEKEDSSKVHSTVQVRDDMYVEEVKKTNPGSYIHVEQNEGRFSKLFICYAACINGFLNGCRPLIFLDGTFLKDRFKGILLSAVAYDGNQGIFPLAYCICDQENTVNWNWFLQGLWSILYERPDPYNPPHKLVIISDADKGIREAVRKYFPDAIHSRCVLHLVENFRTKLWDLGFKAKDTRILGNLFQSACYKYTKAEWNDYVEDIRLADERAYNIVMYYAPENWANAFSPELESFNKWIHEARLLRILQLVEHICKQIMVRMNERRLMAESWNGFLCPKDELVLKENMENGSPLDVC
ncbi:uncharacterized protein LOC109846034 [Asparagus officinalis]|uniref:uncharacterized protein LOC109846034 n=1 Tax=Asparagus officinalis TaxID=4686 RepID=UPI00098E08DC|nr:uncharacterized protein LOC109846034 [Asparagus officinalis]